MLDFQFIIVYLYTTKLKGYKMERNILRKFRQVKRLLNIIETNKKLNEQEKKIKEIETLNNFRNHFQISCILAIK